jgi:hypothetical protein
MWNGQINAYRISHGYFEKTNIESLIIIPLRTHTTPPLDESLYLYKLHAFYNRCLKF